MECNEQLLLNAKESKVDIFLLTKPPCNGRAKLCLQLVTRSENAALYLAGDGVYNLLEKGLEALLCDRVLACKEDLEARGVQTGDKTTILDDFYERLVKDMMQARKIYTF